MSPAEFVDITPTRPVTADERTEVLALEQAALIKDGVSPLDDQVRLDLEFGAPESTAHLLARSETGDLAGYAHLAGDDEGGSGHLAVHPTYRRMGVGTALVGWMIADVRPRPLRLWAHGDGAGARMLAERLGFRRIRDLYRMERNLTDPLGAPAYPAGVSVRTFVPGQDDDAWVAVNAAAFSNHPEQSAMTVDDLRQRMEQPWFDPEGLFLAERGGRLLGFHWTKVHGPDERRSEPIGEVYVVGVDPQAQGVGLGKALTLTGMVHLRDSGLGAVMLYVDGENSPAVKVYEKLGFRRVAVDAMYQRP